MQKYLCDIVVGKSIKNSQTTEYIYIYIYTTFFSGKYCKQSLKITKWENNFSISKISKGLIFRT